MKKILFLLSIIIVVLIMSDIYNLMIHQHRIGYFKNILLPPATVFYSSYDTHGNHTNANSIKGADFFSFQAFNNYYAKDKINLYREGRKVPGIDLKSLQVLGDDYFKDKNGIYTTSGHDNQFLHKLQKITGVDFDTFQQLKENYCKDKNAIYLCPSRKILVKDYSTFETLGNYYAKDSKTVYYHNQIVKEADSESFITIDRGSDKPYGQDKSAVYLWGRKKTNTDPNSFDYPTDFPGP
jgi:hypothetical protein